jgi:hypothetical protein
MNTTGTDLNTANSREAPQNVHSGVEKPAPRPVPTVQVKEREKPKHGVGAKLKASWANLGIDIPTFLMMLK